MIVRRSVPQGAERVIVNVYTGAHRNEETGEFSPDFWCVNTFIQTTNKANMTIRKNVQLPDGATTSEVANQVMLQVREFNPDEIHGLSAKGKSKDPRNTLGMIVFGSLLQENLQNK